MGLDQYAFTTEREQNPEFYWRKHARLQEFMEQLWVSRTGQGADTLNCKQFELQPEDIATLQAMIERDELPVSPGGFFYGHQFQDESASEYRDHDLQFCKWARNILQTRQRVFYSCWW